MTDKAVAPVAGTGALAASPDFRVGSVLVSPARRTLEGSRGSAHLQPQAMAVFLCLTARQEQVVSRRDLFERCWGAAPVGDDSVNQAIRSIRRALTAVSAGELNIETVPRTGYRLASVRSQMRSKPDPYESPVQEAYDCWRLGWPKADFDEIAALEAYLEENQSDAEGWGMLALLLRKAAEYASAAHCSALIDRCEHAARQALSLAADEPNARVALAGLTPLFGNWTTIRAELTQVLERWPEHAPALHDLVFLEMATGRPTVALPMLEQLLARDRLAATYYYKSMYQLWSVGRVSDAERLASRAMSLWPRHPANWLAWYWILVGTGRGKQAVQLIADEECLPSFPLPTLQLLSKTAAIVASQGSACSADQERFATISQAVELASFGPASAIASLQALCVLGAIDEAFEVAYGYYLGRGNATVPLRWNASDPSITDQHRRLTQPLFIPLSSGMRSDNRFASLCADIGLSEYWSAERVVPDYLM